MYANTFVATIMILTFFIVTFKNVRVFLLTRKFIGPSTHHNYQKHTIIIFSGIALLHF